MILYLIVGDLIVKSFFIDEDTIRFSTWNAQVKGGEVVDMYAFRAIIKKKKSTSR